MRLAEIASPFKIGDLVQVLDGPFVGGKAEISSVAEGRLSLLVQLLNRKQSVFVEGALLAFS